MKRKTGISRPSLPMYERIRQILDSARSSVARSVNTTQVVANWLIGREIVEEEQKGRSRAQYGEELLTDLAKRFKHDSVPGYSVQNLRYMRQFYLTYSQLIPTDAIRHALRGESVFFPSFPPMEKGYTPRSLSWQPGFLHPNLSWTHYRTLLRVDKAEARAFYEIEAIKHNWAARELERQINSLLYERLALSRDKKGLMRLAVKGHSEAELRAELRREVKALAAPMKNGGAK